MLRTTCSRGAVSESMVAGYLASMGYEIFLPAQDHGRADLVYLKEGKPVRVQVKTSSLSKASESDHRYELCRLVRANGVSTPYTKDEVDELWVVGTHLWRIPVQYITGMTNITLMSTNPNPRKTVRNYDPNDLIVVSGSVDRPYRDRLSWHDPDPSIFVTNTEYNPTTIRAMKYKERT